MILCLGTTPTVQRTMTFDCVTPDAVNRAAEVLETASGKSINVARTLHTLGQEVLAIGFLGGDTGRLVRQDLDTTGIPHDFIEVTPKTRTCTTVIDRSAGTVTELVEETRPVEASAYEGLLRTLDLNVRRAGGLVLSGSLPPAAPSDFYARCAHLARAAKLPVILDTRGEPLRKALAEHPTVVKPNRLELAETTPYPIDSDEALRRAILDLLRTGPQWAIITDGSRPALACDGQHFWRITPPRIKPVNPIGSGDAFAAGLAIALTESHSLPEACRLAAACGAANALNSPPGHGKRYDVGRLMAEVQVTLDS
jgi:1-phosphofructokinase family hexose kinase